jgi:hypothetical protein
MITWVYRMRKTEVDELSNIPFEKEENGEFQQEVGF